jgi:hypothetical protein
MMRAPEATRLCLTTIAALLLICSGCTSEQDRVQSMEQMLAAAGFKAQSIDTAEKQAQLAALPPHKLLVRQVRAGDRQSLGYVYADPDVCHCVFVGDAQAYQTFSQLAFQKKLAEEYRETAEMAEAAAFNWDMWAPGMWGPPPVVVAPPYPVYRYH